MNNSFSSVSRAIIVTAALVIVIAGMKYAESLLVPFLLAAFIAVISYPLVSMLQQKGLPTGLSLTLVIFLVVVAVLGLVSLIGSTATDFSASLPKYQQNITAEWGEAIQWLNDHGISIPDSLKELVNPAAAVELASSVFISFGGVLANSFMIILTVVFILMEAISILSFIFSAGPGPPQGM